MEEPRKIIRLKAFTGPGWHYVSLDRKTCDCPDFQTAASCKHLTALGIYCLKPFVAKARPTFSQALSGLVKSLRIRRVEDAVYWLVYLDSFSEAQQRVRVARRLLIGSAEDGHAVTVMERVVDGFRVISRRQTELKFLVAEAVRICKIPNWWNPGTGGPDYIYTGMVSERELAYLPGERTLETMTTLIEQGIEEKKKTMAVAGVLGLPATKAGGTRQAELILAIARRHHHPVAERLAQVHLRARSALSSDNNFLCQAAWMMAGGVSPVVDAVEAVSDAEVAELFDGAKERWKAPRPIPGWCCDGTHSAGNDIRFMGVWSQMYAVCRAFECYGRIDPSDEWRPEFQCFDGLVIE